jgi:hypothetical protein
MSNPTLEDSQKHRITERLVAEFDLETAIHKADGLAKRIDEVANCAKTSSKGAAQTCCYEVVRKMELEGCTLKEKVKEYRWQACKLYLYAPLGDVAFSKRRARLASCISSSMPSPRRESRWPQNDYQ